MVKPKEETALDVEVERNECSQNRCCRLHNREQRENHPIRKPLSVVGRVNRVDGLEGHVSGVEETHKIGDELCSANHPGENSEDACDQNKDDGLWDFELCFEILQAVCRHDGEERVEGE